MYETRGRAPALLSSLPLAYSCSLCHHAPPARCLHPWPQPPGSPCTIASRPCSGLPQPRTGGCWGVLCVGHRRGGSAEPEGQSGWDWVCAPRQGRQGCSQCSTSPSARFSARGGTGRGTGAVFSPSAVNFHSFKCLGFLQISSDFLGLFYSSQTPVASSLCWQIPAPAQNTTDVSQISKPAQESLQAWG